jgi:hypothetical protein
MPAAKPPVDITVARLTALQNRIYRRLKKVYPRWMKRRDLYRSLSRPIKAAALDMGIIALKKRGILEEGKVATGDVGRPPTVYRLRKAPK